MDRADRRILHYVQIDAKISNASLAEHVQLSESACSRRLQKLEQNGILTGYVGLVDQTKAGYPDNVFVQITLHSQQQRDLEAFELAVSELPEVMECYLMSGDADYLLRVIHDDERINLVLFQQVHGFRREHIGCTGFTVGGHHFCQSVHNIRGFGTRENRQTRSSRSGTKKSQAARRRPC